MEQRSDVVLDERLGELLAIHGAGLETSEVRLDLVEKLPRGPLEEVRTVQAVRLEDRVREEPLPRLIPEGPDVGDALKRLDHIVRALVPDGELETIRHALRALDEKARTVARLERRRTKTGEARRLK